LKTTGTYTARLLFTSGLVDGKIFVIGGTNDLQNPLTINTVQVFDPVTNAWSTPKTSGTFTPRFYLPSVSAVVNGQIFVIGGIDGKYVLSDNEVFTPAIESVMPMNASSEIEIFPNPTTGVITINNTPINTLVTIENMLGKPIMQLKNQQGSNMTLDLSQLPLGTYFAKFLTSNSVVTKKIIRG
jgi:hypothetical protein